MISLLKYIYKHPFGGLQGILRFCKWQAAYRLVPYPIIYNFTSNSKVVMKKGLTGMTLNYYTGLCELSDMAFLLHFLKRDELFVDVGANVGSYSILALQEVGASVVAIEPIPQTFDILRANVRLNEKEARASLLNFGVGSSKGEISFITGLDAMNHVAIDGEHGERVVVKVDELDTLLDGQCPQLIKIDTEGFESEVLSGGVRTFNNPDLKAVIIEMCGMGERYGHTDASLHEIILGYGFFSVKYDPFSRKIEPTESWNKQNNTIYIRDLKASTERVKLAGKVKIRDRSL